MRRSSISSWTNSWKSNRTERPIISVTIRIPELLLKSSYESRYALIPAPSRFSLTVTQKVWVLEVSHIWKVRLASQSWYDVYLKFTGYLTVSAFNESLQSYILSTWCLACWHFRRRLTVASQEQYSKEDDGWVRPLGKIFVIWSLTINQIK